MEKYYGVVETYYFGSIAVKKLQYGNKTEPVSYTHLTLPTIYSV